MFVSQLYTGSISDEQIVKRSDFLSYCQAKKKCQKLKMVILAWRTKALISKKTKSLFTWRWGAPPRRFTLLSGAKS